MCTFLGSAWQCKVQDSLNKHTVMSPTKQFTTSPSIRINWQTGQLGARQMHKYTQTLTWDWVSALLRLAFRLRQADCMLRAVLLRSVLTCERSLSVAVFSSLKLRRKATTALQRDKRRLCSALKYSLKLCKEREQINFKGNKGNLKGDNSALEISAFYVRGLFLQEKICSKLEQILS